MRILFLTWKDIKHPFAGGAEKVMYEYAKGLVNKGHQVTWFGYNFKNALEEETIDGIEIVRKFSLYTSYFLFPSYYKKHFAGKYDIIIDEAGGLPLLSPRYEKNIPIIFFAHHIGDKEWDYNYPFPLNKIGKQIYFWLFKQYKNQKTITVSNSTKEELIQKFGFEEKNICVIENACDVKPINEIDFDKKQDKILFLGRLMPIKRVEHAILAFNQFITSDKKFKNYILEIVGNNQDKKYAQYLKETIKKLGIEKQVNFLGHIDRANYSSFMGQQKLILVTSIKEGFGLIVIESNSYGIPAIGYNVAGLRDSIKNGQNGYIIDDGNFEEMGKKITEVLSNIDLYKKISISSLEYTRTLNSWGKNVEEFEKFILN